MQTSCNFEKNMYNCDWFLDFVHRLCIYFNFFWNRRITSWYQYIVIALCLVTTIFAYTNIFCTVRHNQIHVQYHVAQGQPSQAIPLNIAWYRKAVYNALWVQVTLVICYPLFSIAAALIPQRGIPLSAYLQCLAFGGYFFKLVHLNSSFNPLLYCWKIKKVRQAVEETLRQLYCC